MTGFIFGGNTGLSYNQLQKQRKQLDAQRGQRFAPKNVGEGLSALGHALGTRITNKRLGEAETDRQGRADNAFSTFQTLLGGGGRQPVNPMQPPSASGDQNAAFGGDLKSGIAATAQSLGVDPVDLATAISYETAGTFDPKKAGPTTQWGQHRGLIQFGEPQAKKYGVNWDDPIGSQLGENGAVANYLRDTGVKPGMGLLDIYSAINAGGVGRYNRSDANNGGAPGNVRDKVEQQMAGHRAKAQAMFGGDQVAQAQPQSSGVNPKLYELMSDPSLSPRRQSAMQMLLEQKSKANAPVDPMKQLQMERLGLQNKQLRNPSMTPYQKAQIEVNREKIQAKSAAGTEYGLNPQYGVDAEGNPVLIQLGKNGQSTQTPLPDGVSLSKKPIKLDAGTHFVLLDPITRQPVGKIEKQLQNAASQKAQGAVEGKTQATAVAEYESLQSKMPGLRHVVGQLDKVAELATYTYAGQARDTLGRQMGMDPSEGALARTQYIAMVDNQVLPLLRDTFGAAFTAAEGQSLRSTLGDPDKAPAEKQAVLRAFIEQKERDLAARGVKAGIPPQEAPQSPPQIETSVDDLLKKYGGH